jgi:hypothetical protein
MNDPSRMQEDQIEKLTTVKSAKSLDVKIVLEPGAGIL